MQHAARQRRATVFGLEPLQALFLPAFISAVAGLATHWIHGSWDVIVVVAVGVYSLSLGTTLVSVLDRRTAAGDDRKPVEQDWLLTVFIIALTILFLTPDDRAIWQRTADVLVIVSGLLLAAREVRRRRGARRPS